MNDRIVIVGGGAGGLELACKLGKKLGRGKVVLVDNHLYHIWKPSLHEVAAGTLDMNQEGLSYSMLAHDNNFAFVFGSFTELDLQINQITVSGLKSETGETVIPERKLTFGTLCIAVGSTSNYFGIPGAEKYTVSLNNPEDAEKFRYEMLKQLTLAELHKSVNQESGVDVVIIGGGATGVELAAELREASSAYINYGFHTLDPIKDVRITLLEGGPRILAPLPERVSNTAADLLAQRHVKVITGCRVENISESQITDTAGNTYRSDICVWAAGIKAPFFLSTLGLPTNKSGQLEVTEALNVKGFSNIYAFGDCAACMTNDGKLVPPRAQAAHQQAGYLYKVLLHRYRGQNIAEKPYVYKDYGSLVSVGTHTSVGNLMGSLSSKPWFIEGFFARMLYMSLHLMHHMAILGWLRTAGLAVARVLIKRTTSLVKLH
jgi:NADH dehydrogenase